MANLFEKPVRIAGFPWATLPKDVNEKLNDAARICKGLAVAAVARANSGHPAGALSSMKMFMATYGASNITTENCDGTSRDFIVISHGHTSAAAYATLAYYGFVDPFDFVNEFRVTGSKFQGHVERLVPGIDWGSGCLGQGLSAAAGFALAQRTCGYKGKVYVLMGDGEQPKGQVAEARKLIVAEKLNNIIALIDANNIQICGRCSDVLPFDLKANWEADGWKVIECDGDSFTELYAALKSANESDKPVVIICKTVIGKGVSFMEDRPDYHGKAATGDLYKRAMAELGTPDFIAVASENKKPQMSAPRAVEPAAPSLELGTPKVYTGADKTDNRSAFGAALAEIGELNYKKVGRTPILVFDCDLAGSVKTAAFGKKCPENFYQCGIEENNVATVAGAASVAGVISVWGDFGIFGLPEVYNQQRMNDINETNEKLILTHVGLDVGEDGMTHQCIDYVGLMSNYFGWKIVVPADPNQTDRATRWALGTPGNICLAMGRSKLPTICDGDKPIFVCDFKYGEAKKVRNGTKAAVLALGSMTAPSLKAAEALAKEGIDVAVYAVSCPLAVDEKALAEAFATGAVITVEDHHVLTGMGSIWLARAEELGLSAKVKRMGVNRYGDSGPSSALYVKMGLTADGIASSVKELLA